MASKQCPECGLWHPGWRESCQCGHFFKTEKKEEPDIKEEIDIDEMEAPLRDKKEPNKEEIERRTQRKWNVVMWVSMSIVIVVLCCIGFSIIPDDDKLAVLEIIGIFYACCLGVVGWVPATLLIILSSKWAFPPYNR